MLALCVSEQGIGCFTLNEYTTHGVAAVVCCGYVAKDHGYIRVNLPGSRILKECFVSELAKVLVKVVLKVSKGKSESSQPFLRVSESLILQLS